MVTPAWGDACAAGFCSVGAFCGGCEPLCGPVGDCARNPNAADNNIVVVAITATNLRMYIAFMPTLSQHPVHVSERHRTKPADLRPTILTLLTFNLALRRPNSPQPHTRTKFRNQTLHVEHKQRPRSTRGR